MIFALDKGGTIMLLQLCTAVASLMTFGGDSRTRAIEPADMVLLGGKIFTLDQQDRVVSALAVRDGRIVAVWTDAELERLAADKTEVIRLGGKTVLPGFIASHCHAVGVARTQCDDGPFQTAMGDRP